MDLTLAKLPYQPPFFFLKDMETRGNNFNSIQSLKVIFVLIAYEDIRTFINVSITYEETFSAMAM